MCIHISVYRRSGGTMGELITTTGGIAAAHTVNEELFRRFAAYLDAAPRPIEAYTKNLRQLFNYFHMNGISRPQREDIIAFRDELKASGHKPTTVQSYITAARLFFSWTAQEGFYPNIADRIKGAKLNRDHKKDYLTTKQVNKLLGAIDRTTLKGKRDYALLALMVTTGLRTISVINANVEDIRAAGDATALFYRGKGHEEKATYVKLAEPVEAAIREYLTARGKTEGREPLFSSVANRNNGGRMTTRSISRVAKESLIEVNLKSDRLTAHSLRHTAATLNLLNGGTVEETQQLLDHANINTTLIYSHALERAKNNSEQRIARAIFG